MVKKNEKISHAVDFIKTEYKNEDTILYIASNLISFGFGIMFGMTIF